MQETTLARRLAAEGLGTCLLLAAVVGSGIMAARLAGSSAALALLCNTAATAAALAALILAFGSISGAHFNPAVTLCDAWQRGLPWSEAAWYAIVQILGAIAGAGLADLMFGEPILALARTPRSGLSLLLSEFVATFGLLATIWGCSRRRPSATPFAVAAYIAAAYWFTASTSFANPAATLARSLTDTFVGIRPIDVPGFIAAQLLGAGAATAFLRWLVPQLPSVAPRLLQSRSTDAEGDPVP